MVTLKNGEVLHFDACIVTCSLGYLKKHHKTLFTPQLTSVKQDAINRMGFGNNLKVFLEYSDSWWNSLNTILILTHGENEDFMVFQPSSWAENVSRYEVCAEVSFSYFSKIYNKKKCFYQ